jgi:hypothetical protein
LSIGFEANANFEGRIVDELVALQTDGTIRILDLLFIARDTDSDEIVVVEHQGGESMSGIVGALLGVEFDDAPADQHSFGFSRADIEEMGAGLEPGGSAGLLLIEHVWARGFRNAVRDAGGSLLGQGFLTPETIAAADPKLAGISEEIANKHSEGT